MTFQGGGFGGEGRDEAKQPPQSPEARPWEEFAPPAYAQPNPNAPKDPPPPAPPWTPPAADYPPPAYQPPAYQAPAYPPPGNPPPPYPGRADYGPPGYPDAQGYGNPSYPPPPPQYGQPYPPPGYGGGYGAPPGYPGPYYDAYQPYRDRSHETNGLAIGSLATSVAGGLLGIPLAFVCYIGILIPIVGAVLGVVALGQIKRTNQQGRGLAIAGIVIGATAAVLLVLLVLGVIAASHSPSVTPSFT